MQCTEIAVTLNVRIWSNVVDTWEISIFSIFNIQLKYSIAKHVSFVSCFLYLIISKARAFNCNMHTTRGKRHQALCCLVALQTDVKYRHAAVIPAPFCILPHENVQCGSAFKAWCLKNIIFCVFSPSMRYLLIMTPDTASSSAAMRAEVPTDRPSARWERDGWGGSRDTSAWQGKKTAFQLLPSQENH